MESGSSLQLRTMSWTDSSQTFTTPAESKDLGLPPARPTRTNTFETITIWHSRGIIRGIVVTLVPLALTIYFLAIWRLFLVPSNDDANNLVFGRPDSNAIYYSWFVLASVGLTIFHYGREGVEEGMLRRPKWSAHNPMHLRDHTRFDGWLRALRRRLLLRSQSEAHRSTSITWMLLGLVTMFGYVGLPLSGLTMEFETGYYIPTDSSRTRQHPSVVGCTKANWNARFKFDSTSASFTRWRDSSRVPPPPGAGFLYTPQVSDRSNLPELAKLPNDIPYDTGVSNIFLAPQAMADVPIDGRSWGLVLSYQCSVVTKFSDFTILSHRKTHVQPGTTEYDVLGNNATIKIYNQTTSDVQALFAQNLQAVAEVGYDWPYRQEKMTGNPPSPSECYNPIDIPGPEAKNMPYPGMNDEPQVLELILWQNLSTRYANPSYVEHPPLVNLTLPNTIPELLGAYQTQNTTSPFPMSAIGVRCTSSSEVGTAQLDGRRAIYTNLLRSDSTPSMPSNLQCAKRLSLGVPDLPFSQQPKVDGQKAEWLSSFYGSVGKFLQGYSSTDHQSKGGRISLQSSYLQAEELRRSLARAYALYALELVYGCGMGYVDENGTYHEASQFVNEEAVGYTRDTVLVPGIVPPEVVVVFLGLWAVGSFCFGVLYGFG